MGAEREIRSFVAVELDPGLRRALAGVSKSLERSGIALPRARWVGMRNFHLTLKFLGSILERSVDDVAAALTEAVTGTTPFEMELRGLGTFPPDRPARILWIGITENADILKRLAESIDKKLEPLGFPREERPFAGHVTLARFRDRGPSPAVARSIQEAGRDFVAGRQRVGGITLQASELTPTGPVYRALKTIPFAQGQ